MHGPPLLALLTLLPLGALQDQAPPGIEPGLTVRHFELAIAPETLPVLVEDQTPNVDLAESSLDLGSDDFGGVASPSATRALGWLLVEQAGDYRFRLTSDDGSRMTLGGSRVVDNDGRHGMVAVTSGPVTLEPGLHTLLVEHFDSGGARGLRLEWALPGSDEFAVVPEASLRREIDPTRVTSPGPKAIVDDRRPGRGLPLDGVHPAWRVEDLRPEGFEARVGSLCFLPDGRLAFGSFDPLQRDEESLPDIDAKAPDTIWALDVETGELDPIATDVYEPAGLCVVDGELYVAQRRSIDRLRDLDGDGYFETHELVAEGWEGWNYHQFAMGLVHRDGKLYTALSTSMAPPKWEGMGTNAGPNGPLRGSVLEIDLETGWVTAIAGGTRTPNGIGIARDRLFYTDNQGAWYPASAMHEVVPGRYFGHYNRTNDVPKLADRFPDGGHPSIYVDRPRSAPVLWLPHGEVVNSPTTVLEIERGPFAGQVLIGELTAGGVRRAYLEEVNGVLQGALFRFTQGLESGVNRMVWGPDGALYVGGIGAGGNWNWRGTRFGLQRLVPTGETAFEIASVKVQPRGFQLEFTREPTAESATDLERYSIESWTYEPTADYGGPKIDVREHAIESIQFDRTRRLVDLTVAGLEAGRVVHITADVEAAGGESLWSAETWYTLEQLPGTANVAPFGDTSDTLDRTHWVQLTAPGSEFAKDGERPVNLSAEELAGTDVVELTVGGPALRLRAAPTRDLYVAFEHRAVGSEGPAADLRMSAAGVELSFSGETIGPDWEWTAMIHVPDGEPGAGDDQAEWMFIEAVGEGARRPVEVRGIRLAGARAPEAVRAGDWRELLSEPFEVRGGEARFELENGVLTGTTRPNTPNTFFTSVERFADFELLFEVRVDDDLNSGVQIRSEVVGGFDQRGGGLQGYQVEIDPSERAWTGGIYEERARGWLHPLHAKPYARRAFRNGEWNRIRVVADGPIVRTWVNGVPAAEMFDDQRADGHIGFQVHGVGGRTEPLTVEWRNVKLRTLR